MVVDCGESSGGVWDDVQLLVGVDFSGGVGVESSERKDSDGSSFGNELSPDTAPGSWV
jgi:hypothetical protein